MSDPYRILGVNRQADETEIKKAFRRLAKAHHPDQNKADAKAAQRFSEINQAYEILSDKEKRARFDRGEIDGEGKPRFAGMGAGGFGGNAGGFRQGAHGFDFEFGPGGGGRGGRRGQAGFEAGDIFSDLFGAMRGGGAHAGSPPRGTDMALKVNISLAEAVFGGKKRIELPTGKALDVNIPAGTSDGQTIRLKGQGFPAAGGENGDALLTIQIEPHPLFRIDGADLRLDLPIGIDEAVLGAKVRVPTLDGPVDLTIAPGSNSGRVLRLRGKGAMKNGGRGDLYVKLMVTLPEGDPALKRLAEDLRARQVPLPRGREFDG